MRGCCRTVLLGVGSLALACGCAPEETETPPALELTGRVVDAAEILDEQFEKNLTQRLELLEQDTNVQLVIATIPDLQGYDISDYGYQLGRDWGIGDAERNDGLMILVAPNERKVRIEVGLGLEGLVKDEEAAEIIRTGILPKFRTGDFENGISQGVDGLIVEVTPIEPKPAELKEAA
ncbi:MAG: TPM domain-containing protein [Erythrobacter sp.]